MTRLRGCEGLQHLCCFRGKISLFQKEGAQGNLFLPGREAAPNPRQTEGESCGKRNRPRVYTGGRRRLAAGVVPTSGRPARWGQRWLGVFSSRGQTQPQSCQGAGCRIPHSPSVQTLGSPQNSPPYRALPSLNQTPSLQEQSESEGSHSAAEHRLPAPLSSPYWAALAV